MKPVYLFFFVFMISCKRLNKPQTDFRITDNILVDGLNRSYTVVLPSSYQTNKKLALVIALHGGGGSGSQFETSSKLSEKAEKSNFIVVYPDGVQSDGLLKARTWNAGTCCEYAVEKNINDVKFISEMIDKLIMNYAINPKKIYATGHSNGGMLAYRLACEIPQKIAAIAPNSCTMVFKECNPKRPMPVLQIHSVLDSNIPHKGGPGGGVGTKNLNLAPLITVMDFWSQKNECKVPAEKIIDNASYTFTQWSSCINNFKVQYYLSKDGGHAWPGGSPGSVIGDTPSSAFNANDLLWDFFKEFELP